MLNGHKKNRKKNFDESIISFLAHPEFTILSYGHGFFGFSDFFLVHVGNCAILYWLKCQMQTLTLACSHFFHRQYRFGMKCKHEHLRICISFPSGAGDGKIKLYDYISTYDSSDDVFFRSSFVYSCA